MSLIPAKLTPPALPPDCVARLRLNDRFSLEARVRLLVVQAPPGYGKTTLVAERLPALEQRAAWLRLDARDDGPQHFGDYFAALLRELCGEAEPARLVLDDAEHLTHPEILAVPAGRPLALAVAAGECRVAAFDYRALTG